MEAKFSYLWFVTVGWSWNCFGCLWWRTWHQHLGQPYLSILAIVSTYTFFSFCCFDRILMSSILSLAQPLVINILIVAMVLIDINDKPSSSDESNCIRKDIWRRIILFLRWAWGTSNEIYNVCRAVVPVPWHSSPPETPPDIFILFFFKILGLYDV